jgi:uncharacterized protein (TIGR03083 family)
MSPTRERFLAAIRTEGDRLFRAAAKDMTAEVPSCPGWKVTDLVGHLGVVHRHKEFIVRTLAESDPPERAVPPDHPEDLLAWYAEGVDLLLDTLEAADPEARTWTWHEPDQTVAFWIRRMAHETAVHRADAQLPHGPPTPLEPDLAADGLDEVLGPITAAYTDDPAHEFRSDGRVVELHLDETGLVRRMHIGTGTHGPGWTYGPGGHGEPTTAIAGRASDLDLWAWGRVPATALRVEGDRELVTLIREVVASVT